MYSDDTRPFPFPTSFNYEGNGRLRQTKVERGREKQREGESCYKMLVEEAGPLN